MGNPLRNSSNRLSWLEMKIETLDPANRAEIVDLLGLENSAALAPPSAADEDTTTRTQS